MCECVSAFRPFAHPDQDTINSSACLIRSARLCTCERSSWSCMCVSYLIRLYEQWRTVWCQSGMRLLSVLLPLWLSVSSLLYSSLACSVIISLLLSCSYRFVRHLQRNLNFKLSGTVEGLSCIHFALDRARFGCNGSSRRDRVKRVEMGFNGCDRIKRGAAAETARAI